MYGRGRFRIMLRRGSLGRKIVMDWRGLQDARQHGF